MVHKATSTYLLYPFINYLVFILILLVLIKFVVFFSH